MQSVIEQSNYSKVAAPTSPTQSSQTQPERAERAIAAGFAGHEAWAYEAAYRIYAGVLMGAAFGVLEDRGEAEDCVQNVMMRLWDRSGGYSTQRGSLRAFLAVCVRNEALMRLRRRKPLNIAQEINASSDEIAAVANSVTLHQSVTALSAEQRGVIEMAYYRGLTHEEIASLLRLPVGTVKSRLSSALRRLRTLLGEDES